MLQGQEAVFDGEQLVQHSLMIGQWNCAEGRSFSMCTHVYKKQPRTRPIQDAVFEQRETLPGVFHHLLDIRISELERQDLRETVTKRSSATTQRRLPDAS